jgi:hypothetical protein
VAGNVYSLIAPASGKIMSRRISIVVLATIVCSLAIGFVIGRSTAPVTSVSGDPAAIGESARRNGTPRSASSSLPGDSAIDLAIASVPPPEIGPEDGVITGRVLVDGGMPLGGVTVSARSQWRPSTKRRGEDRALEEKMQDLIREHLHDQRTRREAISNADGTFRIEGLSDGKYRLWASREGYRLVSGRHDVRPGETVDVSGYAVAMIDLTVLLPDGTPASSATVEARDGRMESRFGVTSNHHVMTLLGGTWKLTAKAEDGILASEPIEITTVTGEPTQPVTLQLRYGPGIRGKVLLGDIVPRRGVEVLLFRDAAEAAKKKGTPIARARAAAQEGCRFVFSNLSAGEYALRLEPNIHRLPPVVVEVGEEMVEQDLVAPSLTAEQVVYVRIVGPDGKDLPSVRIMILDELRRPIRGDVDRPTRMHDGRWRIVNPPEGDDEDQRRTLLIFSPEHGRREVPYRHDRDREISVEFDVPARLRVTVTGYVGSPLVGRVLAALVPAGEPHGRPYGSQEDVLDAQGMKTFSPVVPGAYEIKILLTTEGRRRRTLARIPIDLASGVTEKSLSMPHLYRLTVLAEGKAADCAITLHAGKELDGFRVEGKPEDGRVEFDLLPAGTYTIRADRLNGTMTVRIPGPPTVRFAPE